MKQEKQPITTVGEVVRRYMQRHVVSAPRRALENRVLLPLCEFAGEIPVEQFDHELAVRWILSHKWSPRMMQQVGAIISNAMRSAGHGDVKLNRSLRCPRPRPPMGVSAQQHSALVAIAPPEIGNVLTALWSTGANATELLSCESRHVDDDGDRLKLVIQGNRRRVIYVPPATAAMIRSLIVLNGDGPIFRNRSGDAMKASVLRSNVLRLNRTIGSGTVTTHGYRRSVAERLMRWGVSLDVIHEILGHAHRHVLRYYLAANESAVWDAVSRLDADD